MMRARAILPLPPFPRATPREAVVAAPAARPRPGEALALIAAIREERAAGSFWDAARDPWTAGTAGQEEADLLLSRLVGPEPAAALVPAVETALLTGIGYRCPFTGDESDALSLVRQLGQWRRLIDGNRGIVGAFGFAQWKWDTVEPLLWDGQAGPAYRDLTPAALASIPEGARVACWKARVSPGKLKTIEARFNVVEVEDGFIRSIGLGADCVPPLSIVVDDMGVHYDPARANRLEDIIGRGPADPDLVARAADLRTLIVRHGIGKYEIGGKQKAPVPLSLDKRVVLVVGQVEDDRSVRFGSPDIRSNLALLEAARALEPDARIIYRPHPDITAGHRKGAIPRAQAARLADEIDATSPISDLLARAHALHTMTSLAGFEALLRGKDVICHGQPFYAGWGLTRDISAPVRRRTARPDVDTLAAAVLLAYPRYLDPVTNLPCPPEILVRRLMAGVTRQNDALVPARRLQGLFGRARARMSKGI